LWHPNSFDYLSLSIGERLNINVYVVSSLEFENPKIAKFARSPQEIGYYTAETQAYSWIDGHHIGPKFLGYLTEDNRSSDSSSNIWRVDTLPSLTFLRARPLWGNCMVWALFMAT